MKKTIYLLSIVFSVCFQSLQAQHMPAPDPNMTNTLFLKYSIKKGYNDVDVFNKSTYAYAKIGGRIVEIPCYYFIDFNMVDNFHHVMNDIAFYPPDITRYNYVDSTLFKNIALNQTQFLKSLKNKNAEQRKSYLKRIPIYILDYDAIDAQGKVKIIKVEPYYFDEHFESSKGAEWLPTPDPNAHNVLFLKFREVPNEDVFKVSMISFDSEKRKKNEIMGGLIVYYFSSKKQLDNFGKPMPLGFSTELYPDMKYTYVVPEKYEDVSLDAKQLLNLLKSKTLEGRKQYLEGFKHIYLIDYEDKNFSDVRQKKIIEVRPKYDEDGFIVVPCGH